MLDKVVLDESQNLPFGVQSSDEQELEVDSSVGIWSSKVSDKFCK